MDSKIIISPGGLYVPKVHRSQLLVPRDDSKHANHGATAQYKAVTRARDKRKRKAEKRLRDAMAGGWASGRALKP